MRRRDAKQWIEQYLYTARGHRALKASVLAAGERVGFSERRLSRAGRQLGIDPGAHMWQLPAMRAAQLDGSEMFEEQESVPLRGSGVRTVAMFKVSDRIRLRSR